jgi:hypothetical protein
MAKPTRTHLITVRVTFNKPISRANALREFRNDGDIYSEHYTTLDYEQEDDRKYPGKFKIGAAKLAKATT